MCSAQRTLSKLLALHTFPLIAQGKFDAAIRQAQQAIALARKVAGVVDVKSTLQVNPT